MSPSSDTPRPRRRLFWKYVVVIVVLVTTVLAASSGVELWFTYHENQDALVALQREKAGAAAARIEAFIREIERQMGWTTQPLLVSGPAALEQRRIDFLRLLRQVPAITELSYLDPEGKEQLSVSRLMMDVAGSGTDFSGDPRFTQALARRVYHGPVTFRKESEPYMVLAMAQSGGGVSVANVNLKFIWDVVTQIKIGKAGRAYVVDEAGNLIAHPDISLVLQKTTLATLPQVRDALVANLGASPQARDVQGRRVLTAYATIPGLRWTVFAEQPLEEALEPLQATVKRSLVLLAVGILLALGASVLLARRMVRPIQALQGGAARIGGGDLGHRLDVRTGDELQVLASEFNRMTEHLQESYATLEQRVADRTREVTEALEQQTGTAEILRVISSSPTDMQPVFEAILEKATRLCDAQLGVLGLYDGLRYEHLLVRGGSAEFREYILRGPREIDPDTGLGRMLTTARPVHIVDILDDAAYERGNPTRLAMAKFSGARTCLWVPMVKEGQPVGGIVIYRTEVRPFSDKQIELVMTFGAQAVIAIQNVRLFKELEERNADVTEALEQQTATGEILRVISRSPSDLTPVFETIAASAAHLCDAAFGGVVRVDGDLLIPVATVNENEDQLEFIRKSFPLPIERGGAIGASVRDRRVTHVHDFLAEHDEDDYVFTAGQPVFGYRTILVVPMLRDDSAIGAIILWRTEPRPFGDTQIELVRTFADQAVIAIENVRLFAALQQRNAEVTEALEQQTATAEILRSISGATMDVQPVFETIVRNAVTLCDARYGAVYRWDGREVHVVAYANIHERLEDWLGQFPRALRPADQPDLLRLAITGGEVVRIDDAALDDRVPPAGVARRAGVRSMLLVPMKRDDDVLGVIAVNHSKPAAFTEARIDLLKTFADQAVIAIENVRLFTELQDRTSQLQVANRHKDEFLANMSHELRTPLNAIIGFSEVMIEKMFGDINEKQEEYLNDILSSGRHLLSLINDILDLSKIEAGKMDLDLADFNFAAAIDNALTLVHERAARRGLVLTQEVDERIGDVRGDERKIKQVLLNLLSNAIKFTPEGGRVQVRAVAKGDVVEVSVTDTGVGIAPEDQETVFEEFRQVGTDVAKKHEGTGLGLALTRRFVELHGGNIWLESEVGVGSTFTFAIPVRR